MIPFNTVQRIKIFKVYLNPLSASEVVTNYLKHPEIIVVLFVFVQILLFVAMNGRKILNFQNFEI